MFIEKPIKCLKFVKASGPYSLRLVTISYNFDKIRVPTAQGKWPKKIPVRENTGNLEMLPKHGKNGIWFAQVVNSLIPRVKNISKFATKISVFFFEA